MSLLGLIKQFGRKDAVASANSLLQLELEPTGTCNLRCTMCHVSYMQTLPRERVSAAEIAEVMQHIPKGTHVIIGAAFEPMMNKQFSGIVDQITKRGCSIELTTNGTLLNEENVSALKNANLRIITFSFDGSKKDTYEKVRRRANFEKTIESISAFRQKFKGSRTRFVLNNTVLKSNMGDIESSVPFWDERGFDQLRFIAVTTRADDEYLRNENLFPVKNEFYALLDAAAERLINERRRMRLVQPYYNVSPLRKKFPRNFKGAVVRSNNFCSRSVPDLRGDAQLGDEYGTPVPCRSPWKSARILWDGDVHLCYSFSIGNIKQQSFDEIWNGEKAKQARDLVQSNPEICNKCDYYRFCLKSNCIDLEDPHNHYSGELISVSA